MKTSDFVKNFVIKEEMESGRYSCLRLALKDARMISGRNLKTGKIENKFLYRDDSFLPPNSFIAVINYLLILDMIGEIFVTSPLNNRTNSIYRALKSFSNITDNEIDVVIALRNSLAHNYSLANIPKHKKLINKQQHIFTLNYDPNIALVQFPKKVWNGNLSNRDKYMTQVGVQQLSNVVERVYFNLGKMARKNLLSIFLKNGVKELKYRFTIRY